jgi:hypothetical protein
MYKRYLVTLCAGAFLASAASAHEVNLKTEARELGIAVGQDYTCTAEDGREIARADSEEMFDSILFDIDREHAYIYAVGVGFGAASDAADVDCEGISANLKNVKAKFGLGGTE